MKKNCFKKIFLSLLALFMIVLSANAGTYSVGDINRTKQKLDGLAKMDVIAFVNKTEMIGYRRDAFRLFTSQYKGEVKLTIERLNNILSQIDLVKGSSDFSDSEKQMQISNLYKQVDSALFELDSKTMNYLLSLNNMMPTITYTRFVKKFRSYYNGLNLTDTNIKI